MNVIFKPETVNTLYNYLSTVADSEMNMIFYETHILIEGYCSQYICFYVLTIPLEMVIQYSAFDLNISVKDTVMFMKELKKSDNLKLSFKNNLFKINKKTILYERNNYNNTEIDIFNFQYKIYRNIYFKFKLSNCKNNEIIFKEIDGILMLKCDTEFIPLHISSTISNNKLHYEKYRDGECNTRFITNIVNTYISIKNEPTNSFMFLENKKPLAICHYCNDYALKLQIFVSPCDDNFNITNNIYYE
jgi:hypothetical protein